MICAQAIVHRGSEQDNLQLSLKPVNFLAAEEGCRGGVLLFRERNGGLRDGFKLIAQ